MVITRIKKEKKDKKRSGTFGIKPKGVAIQKRLSPLADLMMEKERPRLIGTEKMGTIKSLFSGQSNPNSHGESSPFVRLSLSDYDTGSGRESGARYGTGAERETGARLGTGAGLTSLELQKVREQERERKQKEMARLNAIHRQLYQED